MGKIVQHFSGTGESVLRSAMEEIGPDAQCVIIIQSPDNTWWRGWSKGVNCIRIIGQLRVMSKYFEDIYGEDD